jgi:hypothetical protein
MGALVKWLFPGARSAREKAARIRERLEAEAEKGDELKRREAALGERSVDATVAGDEETAEELRERRLRLRLEREDHEAAGERLLEELAEVLPAALEEEARAAAEAAWRRKAAAEAAGRELAEAVEAVVQGPARRFVEAYEAAVEAARRASELERKLAEEHEVEAGIDRPRHVDRRIREAAPRGWRALEALRRHDASRAWPTP